MSFIFSRPKEGPFSDMYEGQPITRKVCRKAQRRRTNRAQKQENQENVPIEIAAECTVEDLLRLLEEHPAWMSTPLPPQAMDLFDDQITIGEFLRRMLTDLLADQLDPEWFKKRSIFYERDSTTWSEKNQKILAALKEQPGWMSRPQKVIERQLLNEITVSSLIDTFLNENTSQ